MNKKIQILFLTLLAMVSIAVWAPDAGAQVETNCSDGIDNDGDSFMDCTDSDCASDPACQPQAETNCSDGLDNDNDGLTDCNDQDCANDPVCLPETNCNDGVDNDSDGFTDCNDQDCANDPVCQVFDTETSCSDGIDNDGDSFIDCTDKDCASDPVCVSGKVMVCHKGKKTITISSNAVSAHLAHGDIIGICPVNHNKKGIKKINARKGTNTARY